MSWRCLSHGALDGPWCDDCDPHENCDRVRLDCGDLVDRDCDDIEVVNAGGDGADWLHPRSECSHCDRLWLDVDANAAWYAAGCEQANCNGETHFTGQRDAGTNEDIEAGPCPNWKAAAA